MEQQRLSLLQTLSGTVYRQFLFLYPRDYRENYGPEMARTFRDCCRAAFRDGGMLGLLRLWIPTLLDLSATALDKHVEDGLLRSRLTVIRVASLAAILGSAPLFVTEWSGASGGILWATLLFVGGALGLLMTTPSARDIIKGSAGMSNNAMQLSTHTPWPQARSTIWAISALVGLAVLDLLDIGLDILRDSAYVQPMIDGYGSFLEFVIGAAPRLVVYLVGLWLYRKESAWGALPALMMAAPRAIFSIAAVSGLLAGTPAERAELLLLNVAALAFVLAVAVTGLWAVLEHRRAGRPA